MCFLLLKCLFAVRFFFQFPTTNQEQNSFGSIHPCNLNAGMLHLAMNLLFYGPPQLLFLSKQMIYFHMKSKHLNCFTGSGA